ncbi:Cold shock protein, CspA family [Saccharopolyspora antimicrobica]|uniref:Cold shock protein, CspA family n=1 Tax=Saccharopolyspora antimicrobica TaxID=455193 RepID=A0A1I5M931_9PSEU|nr:cold shock domain-containing protein [Saccharopolyspora antimicrobica]RKT88428.1 putative cold-shock DNA-binding protein [Saccharopolyspora antimicrobica]SFP06003.1 Cold shock protein, CspA family [Saccharopolyspora antimicrobica]
MVTGKVVRFDEVRGYGFVAPEVGGEDVFIHVNDLTFDKRLVAPGAVVEFDLEESDRGPKASNVRMVRQGVAEPGAQLPEEELFDVLSAKEFHELITESLLSASPTITAEQILQVRQKLTQVAVRHGWVEA